MNILLLIGNWINPYDDPRSGRTLETAGVSGVAVGVAMRQVTFEPVLATMMKGSYPLYFHFYVDGRLRLRAPCANGPHGSGFIPAIEAELPDAARVTLRLAAESGDELFTLPKGVAALCIGPGAWQIEDCAVPAGVALSWLDVAAFNQATDTMASQIGVLKDGHR